MFNKVKAKKKISLGLARDNYRQKFTAKSIMKPAIVRHDKTGML